MIGQTSNGWISMDDIEAVKQQLAELMAEHRDLDEIIARLTNETPFDQIQVQRLKKAQIGPKRQNIDARGYAGPRYYCLATARAARSASSIAPSGLSPSSSR